MLLSVGPARQVNMIEWIWPIECCIFFFRLNEFIFMIFLDIPVINTMCVGSFEACAN